MPAQHALFNFEEVFKFKFLTDCCSKAEIPISRGWSVVEIPAIGVVRDEFKKKDKIPKVYLPPEDLPAGVS
jgi:hypothetical protein